MRTGKSSLVTLALGVAITLAMAAVYLFPPYFLRFIEHKAYDSVLRSLGGAPVSGNVVIVEIDEASLAKYGQWPWPRSRIAALLEKIEQGGALSVALDMIFPEPDRTSLSNLRHELKRDLGIDLNLAGAPEELLDNDLLLARVLKKGPFVPAVYFTNQDRSDSAADCRLHPLNTLLMESPDAAPLEDSLYKPRTVVCNIKPLAEAVAHSGFMNVLPDADGVLRRAPLLMAYQGGVYPNLGLAVLLEIIGGNQVLLKLGPDGPEALRAADIWVPLGPMATLLINYRGPGRTFKYISAADLLDDVAPPEALRNKIVFLGASASGLRDIRATPVDPSMNGVEVSATIVDNILNQDFLTAPGWVRGLDVAVILLLGLLSTALLTWVRALWGVLGVIALGAAVWFTSVWLLADQHLVVSPVTPLAALGLNLTCLASCRYFIEEFRARRRAAELSRTQNLTIVKIAALAEYRDPETGGHIIRTQHYVKLLAEKLRAKPGYKSRLTEDAIDDIYRMAPLHDIGKVGIPDAVLQKPDKLTDEEFEVMKRHAAYGAKILAVDEEKSGTGGFLKMAEEIAYSHHERWDGSGYPRGLKGEAIPLSGCIMAVADVYDALINKRYYKPPFSHERAVDIIAEGRGTHFHPDVVDVFLEIHREFKSIADSFADSD